MLTLVTMGSGSVVRVWAKEGIGDNTQNWKIHNNGNAYALMRKLYWSIENHQMNTMGQVGFIDKFLIQCGNLVESSDRHPLAYDFVIRMSNNLSPHLHLTTN